MGPVTYFPLRLRIFHGQCHCPQRGDSFRRPTQDGIPALRAPQFISPKQATFLARNDEVIGVTINGESKAYPIKILNWHEAANDTLGGEAIVVTF